MPKHRISLNEIHKRDHGICHICLEPVRLGEATRDHIIPKSEGGTESPDNLALAHEFCNTWRMSKALRLKPFLLTVLDPEDVEDYEKKLIPAWQLRKRIKEFA